MITSSITSSIYISLQRSVYIGLSSCQVSRKSIKQLREHPGLHGSGGRQTEKKKDFAIQRSKGGASWNSGRKRQPMILGFDVTTDMNDLKLDQYKIALCEPLHDMSNLIKLVLEHIPYHVDNTSLAKQFKSVYEKMFGERTQAKEPTQD